MPCEAFSFILPSISLKAVVELYSFSESLFFLLVLPLDILAMCAFVSLDVLKTTLAVPYGIELRSGYTAVRCTTCFFCHVLSLFYLSADGMKLFNDYQPIKGTSNNYQFVTPVHAGVQ